MKTKRDLMKNCILTITAAVAMFGTASLANATLLAYEGFEYASGSILSNQNGGFGWSQPWQANLASGNLNAYNSLIYSGSFSYTDQNGHTIVTYGNRVHVTGDGTATGDNTGGNTANGQPRRAFSFSRGDSTETTWVSVMALRTGLPYGYTNVNEIYFGRGTSVQLFQGTGSERLTIGRASQNSETTTLLPKDTWSLVNRGSAAYTVPSTVSWTNQPLAFLLIRIDHLAGDDRVNAPDTAYMWINPADLSLEPATATADVVSFAGTTGYERDYWFDTLRLFAGSLNTTVGYGSIEIDEFKVGTTFWDVTLAPVPEPSSVLLSVVGGLGLLMLQVRRKP